MLFLPDSRFAKTLEHSENSERVRHRTMRFDSAPHDGVEVLDHRAVGVDTAPDNLLGTPIASTQPERGVVLGGREGSIDVDDTFRSDKFEQLALRGVE